MSLPNWCLKLMGLSVERIASTVGGRQVRTMCWLVVFGRGGW